MGQPGLFLLFLFFSTTILLKKTVEFSRIQTWIVGVEGKHADHFTTIVQDLILQTYLVVLKLWNGPQCFLVKFHLHLDNVRFAYKHLKTDGHK